MAITKEDLCIIKGCDELYLARHLCTRHYNQAKKAGNLEKYPPVKGPVMKVGRCYDFPEYSIWSGMKSRCLNRNNPSFKNYGGRGIKICKRWKSSFRNFYEDMGPRPSFRHSIDRIDNNGDYEPGNCRWTTFQVQVMNRRVAKKNTSGVTGVTWRPHTKRWRATIACGDKQLNLGYFELKEDAIAARRLAEQKYHQPVLDKA